MLDLRQITRHYAQAGGHAVKALAGIDLSIASGEYVAIVGASGSGKSTMLNVLGLLDQPSSGSYHIDQQAVRDLTDDQMSALRNEKIGFVFQSFHLMPRLSVLENVLLPIRYAKHTDINQLRQNATAHAKALLERIGLGDRLTHKPSELSGGQQQRVAICRALLMCPPLLLADEPTGNLDSKSAAEVVNMLQELHAGGQTIVLVTHDHDVAQQASRIVTLKEGLVIQDTANASREIKD
jgi:putative ABC transport system ATP-binding protein